MLNQRSLIIYLHTCPGLAVVKGETRKGECVEHIVPRARGGRVSEWTDRIGKCPLSPQLLDISTLLPIPSHQVGSELV